MSMFSLLKQVIKSGSWTQCKFCSRALPTVKHALTIPKIRRGESINESGYCTYCVANGLDKKEAI